MQQEEEESENSSEVRTVIKDIKSRNDKSRTDIENKHTQQVRYSERYPRIQA